MQSPCWVGIALPAFPFCGARVVARLGTRCTCLVYVVHSKCVWNTSTHTISNANVSAMRRDNACEIYVALGGRWANGHVASSFCLYPLFFSNTHRQVIILEYRRDELKFRLRTIQDDRNASRVFQFNGKIDDISSVSQSSYTLCLNKLYLFFYFVEKYQRCIFWTMFFLTRTNMSLWNVQNKARHQIMRCINARYKAHASMSSSLTKLQTFHIAEDMQITDM